MLHTMYTINYKLCLTHGPIAHSIYILLLDVNCIVHCTASLMITLRCNFLFDLMEGCCLTCYCMYVHVPVPTVDS